MNAQEEQKPSDLERFAQWLLKEYPKKFPAAASMDAERHTSTETPTWYRWQLSESQAALGAAERERDGLRKECNAVEQTCGKALGYPWFKDDQTNFPGATEQNGVCVGDHVPETIAMEVIGDRDEWKQRAETAEAQLRAQASLLEEFRKALGIHQMAVFRGSCMGWTAQEVSAEVMRMMALVFKPAAPGQPVDPAKPEDDPNLYCYLFGYPARIFSSPPPIEQPTPEMVPLRVGMTDSLPPTDDSD